MWIHVTLSILQLELLRFCTEIEGIFVNLLSSTLFINLESFLLYAGRIILFRFAIFIIYTLEMLLSKDFLRFSRIYGHRTYMMTLKFCYILTALCCTIMWFWKYKIFQMREFFNYVLFDILIIPLSYTLHE